MLSLIDTKRREIAQVFTSLDKGRISQRQAIRALVDLGVDHGEAQRRVYSR
jgi:hypothetical protein